MGLIAAIAVIASTVVTAELGGLEDTNRVVIGVSESVQDRIEKTGLPSEHQGNTVTRTVNADLTVTDANVPGYTVDSFPIVVTNYEEELIPILVRTTIPVYVALTATATVNGVTYPYHFSRSASALGTVTYAYGNRSALSVNDVTKFLLKFDEVYTNGVPPSRGSATVYYKRSAYDDSGWFYNGNSGSDPNGVVGKRAMDAHVNRGTALDFSDIPNTQGQFKDIQLRMSPTSIGSYKIFDYVTFATNGWNTVTNMVVSTNGYTYVTNWIPVKTTKLLTEYSSGNIIPTGGEKSVITNRDFGSIESASVDVLGLQPSVSIDDPSVMHVDSLQSVVIGGEKKNGRYVGGKTLYASVGEMAADEVDRGVTVSVEQSANDSIKLASITVPSGSFDIRTPRYARAGNSTLYVGDDLNIMQLIPSNTTWEMYSSCNGTDLAKVCVLTNKEGIYNPDGTFTRCEWKMDRSTWTGLVDEFPFPHPTNRASSVTTDASWFVDNDVFFGLLFYEGINWWFTYDGRTLSTSGVIAVYQGPDASDRGINYIEFSYPVVNGKIVLKRIDPSFAFKSFGRVMGTGDLLRPDATPVPQITNPDDTANFLRHDGLVGWHKVITVTNRVSWRAVGITRGSSSSYTTYLGPYDDSYDPSVDPKLFGFSGVKSWAGVIPGLETSWWGSKLYVTFDGTVGGEGTWRMRPLYDRSHVGRESVATNTSFYSTELVFTNVDCGASVLIGHAVDITLFRDDIANSLTNSPAPQFSAQFAGPVTLEGFDTNVTTKTIRDGGIGIGVKDGNVIAYGSAFRGLFADWASVPTNLAGYVADELGNGIPRKGDHIVVTDSSGYPVSPSVNGTYRMSYSGDWYMLGKLGWTIQYPLGSPAEPSTVMLTDGSLETKGGTSVTPANLGAVADDSTYQTMAGKANSAVQPETLVRTVNTVKDLHWDPTLQVTWTNVVDNGHIYYVTVTNTNISVAQ